MKVPWKVLPMGDLCSISSGESDTQDAVADGPFAFFDRSRSIKRSTRFLYDCEALIIPGEGREFLPRHFKGKFDLHQRAYALFDFRPELDVRFLYHLLHYRSDYFPSVAVGATVKSLRRRHFEDLPVPVPPLSEQQRIVALLDEAFAGIASAKANAEKNLQNARALFESHLQSLFTLRSRDWPARRLGELSEQITDGTHNSPPYVESGVPMLDSKHVQDDFSIDDSEPEKFISRATDELLSKRCKPRTGDILVSSRGTIGKIAVVREGQDFNIMGNMILIRLPAGMSRSFAAFYLRSQVGHIESISRGVAQRGLYLNQIRDYELPLPPEAKQAEIGKQLDALAGETRRLADLYTHKVAALESLKGSLLHRAFSGELH